eukprot:7308172-Pyramimonas_sp.AAC.1
MAPPGPSGGASPVAPPQEVAASPRLLVMAAQAPLRALLALVFTAHLAPFPAGQSPGHRATRAKQ